jgi:hypothetical protein
LLLLPTGVAPPHITVVTDPYPHHVKAGTRPLPIVSEVCSSCLVSWRRGGTASRSRDLRPPMSTPATGTATRRAGRNGTWHLSLLTVTCCAADARVLKVAVHGDQAPPADTAGLGRPDAVDASEFTPRSPSRATPTGT